MVTDHQNLPLLLSLHLGKTKSILFGFKLKLGKSPNLNVMCKGTIINPKSVVKYLGAEIHVDQHVSGEYIYWQY